MPGPDTNRGAKRARELRAELGLDAGAPVGCVLGLAEDGLGIPVHVTRMSGTVEGVCWQLGEERMLWVHLHEFVPRSRFTLAHELGHVRCAHDQLMIVDTPKTMWGKTVPTETQANAFAAELLAPRPGVVDVVGGRTVDLEVVVELAAHFGVSAHVALYRCVTLGLLDSDAALKPRLDAEEHLAVWERLGPAEHEDALSAIAPADLPRLSPRMSDGGLGALLRGEATVEDVARLAGCEPEALARGLARLGV
ncbi:ImmA/IrrE family metallo-endopeptidase [Paraconexibacter algicola]|uniref:IrrE N-terminal-like domain-containing protein n=1 Tax=Paraconexibacter algicola TaxID=2133960 RepID=A0A2T4ULE1_9ACTN|nr:ImmA/IrrE family metallo-endopeptidase [Paraconexibacter algicola]PTL60067.1 hypothetical protein C7Y72_10630 [Paraconexibacter algicola]